MAEILPGCAFPSVHVVGSFTSKLHAIMYSWNYVCIYHILYLPVSIYNTHVCIDYQYVPHKAVAEVSKIAHYRRSVAVNHGSQSKPTAGPTSGWRLRSVVEVVVVPVVVVIVVVVLQSSVV